MEFVNREIIFYKSHFTEFYTKQTLKVQDKIEYILRIIKFVEKVPSHFLKHLEGTDGLYEIRVEANSNIFRIFCCFDEGRLVVLFNGFQKKSQKTPQKEIEKAELLKNEYFNLKIKK